MKNSIVRSLVCAIAMFVSITSQAFAFTLPNGIVFINIQNLGPEPVLLQVAANCFEAPVQSWANGVTIPVGQKLNFTTRPIYNWPVCTQGPATYDVYFGTPANPSLASYHIVMTPHDWSATQSTNCPSMSQVSWGDDLHFTITLSNLPMQKVDSITCHLDEMPHQ